MDDHPPNWVTNGAVALQPLGLDRPDTVRLNLFLPNAKEQLPVRVDALRLSQGLVDNYSLQAIEMYRCGLEAEDINAMAQAVSVNKYVASLGLSRNKFYTKGAIALCEALKVNQTVATLDLGWNELRDELAFALANTLQINNSLQRLVLDRNKLTTDGISALAIALHNNRKLRYLGLSNNSFNASAGSFLGTMLAVNDTLTTLDLSYNGMAPEGITALCTAIQGMGRPCALQTLNLCCNKIAPAAGQLALALPKMPSLRELNLGHGNLAPSPLLLELCKALAATRSLCNLSFANNSALGDEGTSVVCEALAALRTLRYLDLTDTGMTAAALPSVQRLAASTSGSLAHLHLSQNSIGVGANGADSADAGRLLREAVTSCKSLSFLGLAGCRLSPQHVLDFAKGPLSISGLTIRDNKLGDAAIRKLLDACLFGKLTYMDVAGNNVTSEVAVVLPDLFELNPSLPYIVINDLTIIDRLKLRLPFAEVYNQSPPTREHKAPPNCVSYWDLQQSFPPSSGFSAHSIAHGTPMKRHHDGTDVLLSGLLQWAGKPVKHCNVWEGNKAGATPSLRTRGGRMLDNAVHPTTIDTFENNICGLMVSDDQMRREFNRLDVNGDGYLDKESFARVYKNLEHFGLSHLSQEDLDMVLRPYSNGGRITFDEFCIVMLRLAKR